jgi:hypothetical protein
VSRGYETRDVDFRPVLWVGFWLSVIVVASFALMWLMYVSFIARGERESAPAHSLAAEYARKAPPAPNLQKDPFAEWEDLQRQNEEILSTYGWVDRPAGVVRIPIERAMDLALERGFPLRTDRGLRGDPDPRFKAYMQQKQTAPQADPETQPRKRERKRGDR